MLGVSTSLIAELFFFVHGANAIVRDFFTDDETLSKPEREKMRSFQASIKTCNQFRALYAQARACRLVWLYCEPVQWIPCLYKIPTLSARKGQ